VLITTVVARNYLPQARVLARSFLGHHPGGRVVVLVLDAPGEGLRDDEPFEVVVPAALFPPDEQRELRSMTTIYHVMELALQRAHRASPTSTPTSRCSRPSTTSPARPSGTASCSRRTG
jgi:hypothetical protein